MYFRFVFLQIFIEEELGFILDANEIVGVILLNLHYLEQFINDKKRKLFIAMPEEASRNEVDTLNVADVSIGRQRNEETVQPIVALGVRPFVEVLEV